MAEMDEKVVAITPAMKEGSGLVEFAEKFPDRFFDVGIAEQHACTFAGGLAAEGLKPVACYYSTFLQRAYDQVIHDIALQKLHVVFAIDRGGLVGDDGPTHHGVFDLSYLRCVPNMIVSAPKDEQELIDLLYTGLNQNLPFALRYPRGPAYGVPTGEPKLIPVGSWEELLEGEDGVILAVGYPVYQALKAAEELRKEGIRLGVVNARFVKPMDEQMLLDLCGRYDLFITVEDNTVVGGFGSGVLEFLSNRGILKRVITLGVPDRFIEHGNQNLLRNLVGIDAEGIARSVRQAVKESALNLYLCSLAPSPFTLLPPFWVCVPLFRRPLCGLLSVLLMLPAFGLFFFSLFYSYLREKTFPLGDPYGFISFLGNLFVPTFLFLAYKYRNLSGLCPLGGFCGIFGYPLCLALFTFSLQEHPLWSSSPFCIFQLPFCLNGRALFLPSGLSWRSA
jgi:transketolase C-terminal domain/subunit